MGTEKTSPGLRLKSSIADVSQMIKSIIDDAESAAEEIRAEAKADAEREAQQAFSSSAAELTTVVQPLVERVEGLRVEVAALMNEIEAATSKLQQLSRAGEERLAGAAPAPPVDNSPEAALEEPPEPKPPTPDPVAAASAPGPVPVAYPGKGGKAESSFSIPEEAVLRATQMAVAGSSRSEIESTLRDEFDLEDAGPVVNEILGAA